MIAIDRDARRIADKQNLTLKPLLTLYKKLLKAKSQVTPQVDLDELITLTERTIAVNGQAKLELDHWRRMIVVPKLIFILYINSILALMFK